VVGVSIRRLLARGGPAEMEILSMGEFPYQYGSDLHWLWGWGDRLSAFLGDDNAPNRFTCELFRPDKLAADAMAKLDTTHREAVAQIRDHLEFVEAIWARFAQVEFDPQSDTAADLIDAMMDLSGRIDTAVKVIADVRPSVDVSQPEDKSSTSNTQPKNFKSGELDTLVKEFINHRIREFCRLAELAEEGSDKDVLKEISRKFGAIAIAAKLKKDCGRKINRNSVYKTETYQDNVCCLLNGKGKPKLYKPLAKSEVDKYIEDIGSGAGDE
jgi:hypothetical protein